MSKIILPQQSRYLEFLRYRADPLILEMESYAEKNNIPILHWHSADFMEQLIRIYQPKRVLEIGAAIAYTTIRIATNLNSKSIIHTIEKSKDNIKIAEKNIEKSKYGKKIKIIEGDALRIMPQLEKKYDFIFLDADKEDYKRLFDYSMLLLHKGGVIVVDNLLWHGYAASAKVPLKYRKSTKHIRDFNKVFLAQKNLHSVIVPIGDGLGIGVKK
jgi:predicted O-methyltransferase YrrM